MGKYRHFFMLLVFCLLHHIVAAQEFVPDEKPVTYQCQNKPLSSVLKELTATTGVSIVFSESKIQSERQVTYESRQKSLGSVLTDILQPLALRYELVGDQIVIVRDKAVGNDSFITFSGYIRDVYSKEYLISAAAYLQDYSRGCYTNEYGFFSLRLPKTRHRLHFSYLGYKNFSIDLDVSQDTIVDVFLTPEQLVLNEVLVAENQGKYTVETPSQQRILPINKIQKGNHLMGEADAFRFISMMPGVSTGADGVGGLNVRGGSYDQNLILLDGVPLFNAGHALGIFSIFNGSSIKNVNMINGAIPARYGGRLSSVIDVQTKDGNMEKTTGEVSMSLISLKASVEGPLIKNKLSYHISARRTFLDIWLKELAGFIGQEAGTSSTANYYFYDINGKIHWRINDKNRVIVQMFNGRDRFQSASTFDSESVTDINESNLGWGNKMISARWSSQWTKNIFSKMTFYQSTYQVSSFKNYGFLQRAGSTQLSDFWSYLFDSSIDEKAGKFEIDYLPSINHYVKFGIGAYRRRFTPGTINVSEANNPELSFGSVSQNLLLEKLRFSDNGLDEVQSYIEDDWTVNDFLQIQYGIHASALFFDESRKPYLSVQPRLALLTKNGPVSFKIGASNMMQYAHLLSNSGLGLPTDIWIGANDRLLPQTAWIYSSTLAINLGKGYDLGVDVYYKNMKQLTSFKEGEPVEINDNTNWSEAVPTGTGEAYGAELYFEKYLGRTNIQASYSYSVSNRNFADLNVGNPFPFSFNRQHTFKLNVYRKLSDFSEFSMNWIFASGNHYTRPEDIIIDVDGKIVLLYPEKNNTRFEPYHRLDLGFGFYNKFSWGKTKLFLGLYNVYNRRNYYYVDIARNRREPQKFELNSFALLPVTPNISYTVEF